MNTLIDSALAEDRLAEEGVQLQRRWISVADLIQPLRELRAIDAPHSLRIILPDQPVAVYVDQHWISLVLLSLLDNAVKYSPEGGEIQIIARHEDNCVKIQFVDQGIGVPAEFADKIFERFVRADNARKLEGSSGLGVGLFLAKSIVTLHSGQLEYRPNPAGGSIFICTLPLSM